MLALSRAARSFVLYDPGNAMVRQLLSEYREKTRAALDAFGEIPIDVRPFELALGGVVVYQDVDRERSLAFRLYRDGVRRLTFRPSVPWEELLTLLQILAICYTSVRQQEEDTVTLLRKAEFRGIGIEAVAGFVPAEANPEPELEELVRSARPPPPASWDVPMPRLPAPGPLQWQEVPAEALEALRRQESVEATAATALSLARDLPSEAARAGWPRPNHDLVQFFAELRDFLLSDGQLAPLRKLVDLIGSLGDGEIRDEVLRGLGDARTLDLVLQGLPEGASELPPDLTAFVPLLGMKALLDRLVAEAAGPRRRLLAKLLEARLPRDVEAVLERLPALEPSLAGALARAVVARAPRSAAEAGRRLLEQADERLRLEGLAVIEASSGEVAMGPLLDLLHSPSEGLRVRAAEVIGRRGDETAVAPLRQALEESPGLSPREAEALGRALAELAPIPAARLLAGWLEPKGRFLLGLTDEQKVRQWAAVAGLGALPGPHPERQLMALAERSTGELRKHCLATLAGRRKGHGHG
jgi:hypothetical protein